MGLLQDEEKCRTRNGCGAVKPETIPLLSSQVLGGGERGRERVGGEDLKGI
jgi:hypothetical protein